jgi:putative phage-type endonuclease
VDKGNKLTQEEANTLEEKTRNQSLSKIWFEARRNRITASNFGQVCKATEARNIPLLCETLYSPTPLHNPAISHGKIYEETAIQKFQKEKDKVVQKCGLFVDPAFPFLGASPDGLTDKGESIIEVKCPYNGRNSKILPGKFFPFLQKDQTSDKISLRKNHNYWYQIQGQLGICKKSVCYFIVFTHEDLFVEKIEFDSQFFHQEILSKLKNFYETSYRAYVASQL